MRVLFGVVAGLLAAAFLAVAPLTAGELKVLTSGAFKPILTGLLPGFEAESGDHVRLENDTAGALFKRVSDGEACDLLILTRAGVDELEKAGRIVPGSAVDLARVGVGLAVRKGVAHPDISTVAALKQTLLSAKSIAFVDPAAGGSSGIYIKSMLQRLGIADAVAGKTVLVKGGLVLEHVVNGEAELGLQQISEILTVAGADLVGPLPPELQNYTIYTAAIPKNASAPGAAKALLERLRTKQAIDSLRAKGMEPAPPRQG
jgi:molybdate transport system substrate-binding protein